MKRSRYHLLDFIYCVWKTSSFQSPFVIYLYPTCWNLKLPFVCASDILYREKSMSVHQCPSGEAVEKICRLLLSLCLNITSHLQLFKKKIAGSTVKCGLLKSYNSFTECRVCRHGRAILVPEKPWFPVVVFCSPCN